MSAVISRRKRVRTVVAFALGMLVLVGGCSNTGTPISASAIVGYAVDFAREGLAAWIL
ncbi:MAG: hypothetical protein HY287_03770 [Planctomycetes bacterium]|nr:hypothetical protein [Planctomycetota bacterium]